MSHEECTRAEHFADSDGRRGRPGRRWAGLLLGLASLALGLAACAGCDPMSFTAGYVIGRFAGPPMEFVTVERICYQDGVRIECP